MGILVVTLGAHRHEVGDLVFAPGGVVDAGALPRLFGAGAEPTAIDEHGRQPGHERRLGRRPSVAGLLGPPIAIVQELAADLVGDPPRLPAADVDFGLIGERFRSSVERSASYGSADDLTTNRRRKVVRVESQARA